MRNRGHKAAAAVAAALAAVLFAQSPGWAKWVGAAATFIDIRDLCRDGIRFDASVLENATVNVVAVAAQPVPAPVSVESFITPDTVVTAESRALRQDINADLQTVDPPEELPDLPGTFVSHKTGAPLTLPFTAQGVPNGLRRELVLGAAGINLEDWRVDSELFTAQITDCYLFAPIDVVPGSATNPVRIGSGRVTVALLGTPTLRADLVDPGVYRFGPDSGTPTAAPLSSRRRDVNRDGRTDLLLQFSSAAAGFTCETTTALLTGQTASGGKVEGRSPISPVGCDG